jgi:hypothetical protein
MATTQKLQQPSQYQQNFYYDENDVLRYDADLYHQKYGNKWKKFASSVRDVKQEDGSIIREYLIEDPSLLEELSDDDFDSEDIRQEIDQEVEKIHQQIGKNLINFYLFYKIRWFIFNCIINVITTTIHFLIFTSIISIIKLAILIRNSITIVSIFFYSKIIVIHTNRWIK